MPSLPGIGNTFSRIEIIGVTGPIGPTGPQGGEGVKGATGDKGPTGDDGKIDLLNANFRGNMSLQGIDSLEVADGSHKFAQLTIVQTDLQEDVPDNYEAAREKYSAIALIVPQWKSQQTLSGDQLVMDLKEKAIIAVGKKQGLVLSTQEPKLGPINYPIVLAPSGESALKCEY